MNNFQSRMLWVIASFGVAAFTLAASAYVLKSPAGGATVAERPKFTGLLNMGERVLYLIETDDTRTWVRMGGSYRGKQLVHYDENTRAIVLAFGDEAVVMPLEKGRIHHVDPRIPLSREEGVLVIRDQIGEIESGARRLLGYERGKLLGRVRDEADAPVANPGDYQLWRAEVDGRPLEVNVKKYSTIGIPREISGNLTKADWERIDLEYGSIQSGRAAAERSLKNKPVSQ